MFTGLVVERGRLTDEPVPTGDGGVRLVVGHSAALGERLPIGASLAVSGTCLTVVAREEGRVVVELSPETLARTTLGRLRRGSEVNLEPALRVGDPLGGHWVQGHVDGRAELLARDDSGEFSTLEFALAPELGSFVVEKGSVAVDGVSLTVARCDDASFSVALIPHTLAVTTFGHMQRGAEVNLEVDILAKYIQRALAVRGLAPPTSRPTAASPGPFAGPLE